MFLDDELLKIAREADVSTPGKIQQLNKDLCRKCQDYYKSNLPADSALSPKKIKMVLDKTFNLWDSFVRMAKKDDSRQLNILANLFEKYSFKYQFLQNEDMNKIYNKLKQS